MTLSLRFSLAALGLCLLPFFSFAASVGDVVINEVAWMGTKASIYGEWIELRNTTNNDLINLAGWVLYKNDKNGRQTKIIDLTGSISAGAYYLIERTTPSSPDPVSNIVADVSGAFGDGSLSNDGEHLVLKDNLGNIIDDLNASNGWPAGIALPDYKTMERMANGNWQTNDGITINGRDKKGSPISGTPRAQNSNFVSATSSPSATPTPSPTSTPTPTPSPTSTPIPTQTSTSTLIPTATPMPTLTTTPTPMPTHTPISNIVSTSTPLPPYIQTPSPSPSPKIKKNSSGAVSLPMRTPSPRSSLPVLPELQSSKPVSPLAGQTASSAETNLSVETSLPQAGNTTKKTAFFGSALSFDVAAGVVTLSVIVTAALVILFKFIL